MQLLVIAIAVIGFVGFIIGSIIFSSTKNEETRGVYVVLFTAIFTIACVVYAVKYYIRYEAIKACKLTDPILLEKLVGTWQGESGIYTYQADSTFSFIGTAGQKSSAFLSLEYNFVRFSNTEKRDEILYSHKICCINSKKMQFRYINDDGRSSYSNIKLEKID